MNCANAIQIVKMFEIPRNFTRTPRKIGTSKASSRAFFMVLLKY